MAKKKVKAPALKVGDRVVVIGPYKKNYEGSVLEISNIDPDNDVHFEDLDHWISIEHLRLATPKEIKNHIPRQIDDYSVSLDRQGRHLEVGCQIIPLQTVINIANRLKANARAAKKAALDRKTKRALKRSGKVTRLTEVISTNER